MKSVDEDISMCDVLVAAGWICGEYGTVNDDTSKDIIAFLLSPRVLSMPISVQLSYLLAFLKLFARSNLQEDYSSQLEEFIASTHLEVQDRVFSPHLGHLHCRYSEGTCRSKK
jgi:hypothetical protein